MMVKPAAVAIVLFVGLVSIAEAVDEADTLALRSVRAYGGIAEEADILIVAEYEIAYATNIPTTTAAEAFIFHYYDRTAGIRRSATPFVKVNGGYGNGVVSIYFEGGVLGHSGIDITWGDPDFVRLTGSPVIFDAPQETTRPISWRATTTPQVALEHDIRQLARTLETRPEWAAVDLIASGLLTVDGEDYFETVIPNLRRMAPSVFEDALSGPIFDVDVHTQAFGDDVDAFFAGSAWSNTFPNLATFLGIPTVMAKLLVAMVILIAAIAVAVKVTDEAGAAVPAAAIVMAATLGPMGLISIQVIAAMGFMAALGVWWMLMLKRA